MSRVANHQISEIIRTLSLVKNITHTVLSCGGRGQRIFRELHGFQGETKGDPPLLTKFVLGLIAECIQQTDTNNATKRPADQIILSNSTCKVVLDLSRD